MTQPVTRCRAYELEWHRSPRIFGKSYHRNQTTQARERQLDRPKLFCPLSEDPRSFPGCGRQEDRKEWFSSPILTVRTSSFVKAIGLAP